MVSCDESGAVDHDGRGDRRRGHSCRLHQVHGPSHRLLRLQTCYHKAEEKSIVCYFTNWAQYRSGRAKFTPENINATLCTHINYAFASLNETSFTIVSSDEWADINQKFFELVVAFKEKGLKVLLSIGGWNDSAGDKWSRLIRNTTAHATFVSSVVEFLGKHGFDGLDMDYEYPACPQGNKTTGLPTDRDDFNKLMSALKDAFKDKYLLTIATPGLKDDIDKCYNMADLCEIVDQVNVMGYDYHSLQMNVTGAVAPMFGSSAGWGVLETVKYYLDEMKCPAEKLVLGIPFYGKSYTLADKSKPYFGVNSSALGKAGLYTKANGSISYFETCLLLKDGWKSGFNNVNGSSAWNDDQFISLASQVDVIRKTCLIRHFKLKGAMLWALDNDDFNDLCGCGSYPLLHTLNQQLRCQDTPRAYCH